MWIVALWIKSKSAIIRDKQVRTLFYPRTQQMLHAKSKLILGNKKIHNNWQINHGTKKEKRGKDIEREKRKRHYDGTRLLGKDKNNEPNSKFT